MSEEEESYYTIFDPSARMIKKKKMSPNDILRTKELMEELEQTNSKMSNLVNELLDKYGDAQNVYKNSKELRDLSLLTHKIEHEIHGIRSKHDININPL